MILPILWKWKSRFQSPLKINFLVILTAYLIAVTGTKLSMALLTQLRIVMN